MRANLLDELHKPYVTTARAKGLKRRRVLWRHAVPNAFLPTFTLTALNLGILLAGIGDRAGATAAFESVVAGSDTEQAAAGRLNLLWLRERYLPPGVFSTPFPQDLEPLQALEVDSADWHAMRRGRIGYLQVQGSRLIVASMRGKRDRVRQFDLYVSVMEIAERIAGLARSPEELAEAVDAYHGAIRIGEALADRFPQWPGSWRLATYAALRLADLHAARSVTEDARTDYGYAYAQSVELSRTTPASVGPTDAARCCRKLAALDEDTGAEPAAVLARLEEAASWSALARERQPANVDAIFENCLDLRLLAVADPARTAEAATRIISSLDSLDTDGNLPPSAAQTLAWARGVTADRP
jgi:hypothetical protein